MIDALSILAGGLVGGWLYRWRGGGYKAWFGDLHIDRIYKALLIAAGLTAPAGLAHPVWFDIGIVYAATLLAILLGHGAYMDLGRTQPERAHDRIGAYQEEPDHGWLLRKLIPGGTIAGSRRGYELLALPYTGVVITLWPAIALHVTGEDPAALIYLAAGATKGVLYEIAWRLNEWRWRWFPDPIAIGESLFGAALGAAVAAALLLGGGAS